MTPAAALVVSAGLAVAGGWAGWLDRGGVVAASLVATSILIFTDLPGFLLLALFFISGSFLTYRSVRTPERQTARPPARTWRQVIANGGWAAAGAAVVPTSPAVGWAVLAGALAAAQADTWGTEIGARSRRPPRLITSGRSVPPGTSGGVTVLGSAAGVVGAGLMATLALLLGVPFVSAGAAVLGGVAGTLMDSVLGATIQGTYRCDTCEADGEQRIHTCGQAARLVCGLRWVDNDVVNLAATGVGAATAVGIGILWCAASR